MVTEASRPVGPHTKRIRCSTSKAPALVDGILVANYLFGIGLVLYQHDAGKLSDNEATAAVIFELGLTALFIASANVGINRADACREAQEKLYLRSLRRARDAEAEAEAEADEEPEEASPPPDRPAPTIPPPATPAPASPPPPSPPPEG